MVEDIKYRYISSKKVEKSHPKMAYVLRFSLGFESSVGFEPYVPMLRIFLDGQFYCDKSEN